MNTQNMCLAILIHFYSLRYCPYCHSFHLELHRCFPILMLLCISSAGQRLTAGATGTALPSDTGAASSRGQTASSP